MALPPASTTFNRWLIIRLIALLLSIASIGMVCSILPLFSDWDLYSDGLGEVNAALPLGGNAYTVIYNGIILILFFCRCAYHPGIDIAFDFIGWGLNWAMGIVLVIWATYADWSGDCDLGGTTAAECEVLRRIDGIQYTSVIIALAVGTSHLAFFVKACVETHHLRITDERSKFMELGGMNRA